MNEQKLNRIWYEYVRRLRTEPGEYHNLYYTDEVTGTIIYTIDLYPYDNYAIFRDELDIKTYMPLPDWILSERNRYQNYASVNEEEIIRQCQKYIETVFYMKYPATLGVKNM